MLQRIIIKECLVKGIYFAPLNHSHNNYSYWCLFKNVNFVRIKVPENVRIKLLFWSIYVLGYNYDKTVTVCQQFFLMFFAVILFMVAWIWMLHKNLLLRDWTVLKSSSSIVINIIWRLFITITITLFILILVTILMIMITVISDHPPEESIIFYLIVLGSPSPCEERSHLRVNQS